ncbi:lysophospholipid acyltransferase family protein [Brachybacterium phenoliresistens]|uniref:Glycerol acyltransferase n=1 Tax=Brachybacterium phenoliresistens TaxID=396014 RepID=Z9JXJ9_9MICO|nr:lysophospholipid acyltransferase family protein [Brachybacterium phenoliresistens]EWS82506.1 glycerol acyltransferase [Brachybacterium phenoliresistens]
MTRRPPERRAGVVIDLAQLVLRPLSRLLAPPTWIGAENLSVQGAAIACGNHAGPWDAIAYGHLLQAHGIAPRFLAKSSLFAVPVLGALLRSSRQIPVARGSARTADALSAAEAALGRGELIMLFPEGTYTRDPDGWPMRARLGAARLALRSGAPLIPIACAGSREFWRPRAALPRPRRPLTLQVGEPFAVVRAPGESEKQAAERVTAELMARITAMLAGIRGEQPPAAVHDPRGDHHRPEEGRP